MNSCDAAPAEAAEVGRHGRRGLRAELGFERDMIERARSSLTVHVSRSEARGAVAAFGAIGPSVVNGAKVCLRQLSRRGDLRALPLVFPLTSSLGAA